MYTTGNIDEATLEQLKEFRQELHRHPELSGMEQGTSEQVVQFLQTSTPDTIVQGIGGHGLAAIYNGENEGPTVAIRCELDALPIAEGTELPYHSTQTCISHKCGHDGHMAIVAGLASALHNNPPKYGRAVLLFQPAEETGQGAERVVNDTAYQRLAPDYVFGLHNIPGIEQGELLIKPGTFACASRGVVATFTGATAHAAHPESANSPTTALAQAISAIGSLSTDFNSFALATITHISLGERTFGITPGHAELLITLRSETDDVMQSLMNRIEQLLHGIAAEHRLGLEVEYDEIFPATVNSAAAYQVIEQAFVNSKLPTTNIDMPFRWSEDFGRYSRNSAICFFGIGAGKHQPQLHHASYDFPDSIIAPGVQAFTAILQELLYR